MPPLLSFWPRSSMESGALKLCESSKQIVCALLILFCDFFSVFNAFDSVAMHVSIECACTWLCVHESMATQACAFSISTECLCEAAVKTYHKGCGWNFRSLLSLKCTTFYKKAATCPAAHAGSTLWLVILWGETEKSAVFVHAANRTLCFFFKINRFVSV